MIIMLFLTACTSKDHSKKANDFEMIKAAHYFSDAWPKTFWQEFEIDKVESELEQIKSDGFNTIVLVIPWRGFEYGFDHQNTTSNAEMYQRLDFLLSKITSKKLDFILRVGFPHNFDPEIKIDIAQTCQQIYIQEKTQKQWLGFLNKLQNKTKEYQPYLSGVLISWEDFWCPHFIFPHLDKQTRLQLAQSIGYTDWLMQKDLTLLKVLLGRNEIKKNEISLPNKQDGDYFYYIEFIDQQLNKLILNPAKQVFPEASMEIRIDKDPAKAMNGENIWVSHDLHLDDKKHRGTYWAPFWGADNNGEIISLKQALFNFEYFLNYVTDQGKSTNHVIEQFNFTDNTPYFPNNAKLADDEVDDFLLASVPLLKKFSAGYGVWAYKDYADNALYNSSFEIGLSGWASQGNVEIITNNQDKQLQLNQSSSISQSYKPTERFMLANSYSQLNLCLDVIKPGRLEIYVNQGIQKSIDLEKGNQCYQLQALAFVNDMQEEIKFVAKTDLTIDEIKLYGFVQKLGLYDEFGQKGPYLDAIQLINTKL
jgi:hypothetical protein